MSSVQPRKNSKKKKIKRKPRFLKDRRHNRSLKTGYLNIGRKQNNDSFKKNISMQRLYNPTFLYQTKMLLGIYITFPQRNKLNQNPKFNNFRQQIRKDNFVSFEEYFQGSVAFMGNPRSLPTVLEQLRENENKIRYSSNEMFNLFLVYVDQQKLYSLAFETYLRSFWKDILELCRNPDLEAHNYDNLDLHDDLMQIEIELSNEASPQLRSEFINQISSQQINSQQAEVRLESNKAFSRKSTNKKKELSQFRRLTSILMRWMG